MNVHVFFSRFDILITDGTGKKLVEPPHDKKTGIGGHAVLSAVFADKKSTLNKFFYVRPHVKVDLEVSESEFILSFLSDGHCFNLMSAFE